MMMASSSCFLWKECCTLFFSRKNLSSSPLESTWLHPKKTSEASVLREEPKRLINTCLSVWRRSIVFYRRAEWGPIFQGGFTLHHHDGFSSPPSSLIFKTSLFHLLLLKRESCFHSKWMAFVFQVYSHTSLLAF